MHRTGTPVIHGGEHVSFLKTFGTDEACLAHMQSVRWPYGPVCPKCGTINEAKPVGGRPGVFRCSCSNQFTVTVGTAMEGTHLPLRHWYLAMYLMMSTAKPISAMSLSRQMGIQYRTCWHLLHRLRAMLTSGETMPLSGIVEPDETYVGGKARNRQKHRPPTTRDVAAAQVILGSAVGQALPEPGGVTRRKRGSAVRGGDRAPVRSSPGAPPSNVADSARDEAA